MLNRKTVFFFCYMLTIAIFLITIETVQASYYVAPNGSDESEGTYSSPWQSIQYAVNRAEPGDVIFVREGTYKELVVISNKEAADGQWITIKNFQNETPIIDAEGLEITPKQRAGFEIKDSKGIRIEGFEIRNVKADSQESFPAGILVRGHNENIDITENNIHHIANYAKKGNAHGIIVYGNDPQPIQDIRITNNKLSDLTLGRSESLTLSGNIENFVIDKNILTNNNNIGIDAAGRYGACDRDGCIDYARNGVISNNLVSYMSSANNPAYEGSGSSAGIYIDGAQNIVVEKNHVINNDFGISVSSEEEGFSAKNIVVRNNFVSKNTKAGLILGGASIDNGGAENILIIANKFTFNDRSNKGYREVTIQNHTRNIEFSSNTYLRCSSKEHMNISKKVTTDNRFKNESVFSTILCK
ncbi:right-handed parallel beta-helix repeat-containing protein [Solibacillus sp. FSL R7-0668]|uniref:right-handed parallel beta-helix repeat-containing protein n=1 Tax=Solibacillus sp. FSL R7-0668 TaxID=2921688 RepID=UPI0030F63C0C